MLLMEKERSLRVTWSLVYEQWDLFFGMDWEERLKKEWELLISQVLLRLCFKTILADGRSLEIKQWSITLSLTTVIYFLRYSHKMIITSLWVGMHIRKHQGCTGAKSCWRGTGSINLIIQAWNVKPASSLHYITYMPNLTTQITVYWVSSCRSSHISWYEVIEMQQQL